VVRPAAVTVKTIRWAGEIDDDTAQAAAEAMRGDVHGRGCGLL
jgi:hypothetical protein